MTRDDEIKLKVATIFEEAVGEKKKTRRRLLVWAGSACAAILNASIAFALYLNNSPPNTAILLSPLTTQEAVLSSRIAGTQATMTEVLEFEADEFVIATQQNTGCLLKSSLRIKNAIQPDFSLPI